jgi:MFS family permease
MPLFYGWVIVGVGIVITCVGFGAMLTLSIFLQPIVEAMGWSRTGVAGAALLNFLCMGVGAFLWGSLSDRYGTRVVVLSGGALMGLGMVLASQATTLLQFQLLYGVIVGVSAGSFYAPLISATTRWFTEHRSLAVSLVAAGLSVGSTVMGPLSRWLITSYDWRTAMWVIGDLVWLVVIPAAFLVRNPPGATATATARVGAGPGLTIGQVVRTPQFAAVALTHFACCAAHSGPIFHMVTHALDRGVPAMAAATVMSAAGLASLTGKIGCGIFADRMGAKRTLVAGLTLQAVAISLYLFTGGLASFYALAAVFGFAYGGVMPLYAIVVREYFGERIMGSAFGAVSLAATLGMALGPWLGGWAYDAVGSYAWMFVGSSAIGLGAAAIALTFRPPRLVGVALPSPRAAR